MVFRTLVLDGDGGGGGGEINMSSLLQWKEGLPETVYDKAFFNANADPEQKQRASRS